MNRMTKSHEEAHRKIILMTLGSINRHLDSQCNHKCNECPFNFKDDPNDGCHNLKTYINSTINKLEKYFNEL